MSRNPIIIGHHIMWTLYGWWLPNDPRGSTSRPIRNDLIAELGELHFGRKAVQPAGAKIRQFYKPSGTAVEVPVVVVCTCGVCHGSGCDWCGHREVQLYLLRLFDYGIPHPLYRFR